MTSRVPGAAVRRAAPAALSICISALIAGACAASAPRPARQSVRPLSTTAASIALGNLEARVSGMDIDLRAGRLPDSRWAELVDGLLQRHQFLARVSDLDRALRVAEDLVAARPDEARSYQARAAARSALHLFPDASSDLDRAAALGADVSAQSAGILQASGMLDDALAIRQRQAQLRPTIATLSALASVHAERGETGVAAGLFASALACYRDVSPFPVAWVLFQEGRMWIEAGDLDRAGQALRRAHDHLPQYVAATTHLAEVEAALGRHDEAIGLLRSVVHAEDPDSAAQLARILFDAGRPAEGEAFRTRAWSGYQDLFRRHPAAYADHAAEFWLAAGRDPSRALEAARFNLTVRPTARARRLLAEAVAAQATG